jgi:hypothetical protein
MDDQTDNHLVARAFSFVFIGGALALIVFALMGGSDSLFS